MEAVCYFNFDEMRRQAHNAKHGGWLVIRWRDVGFQVL